MSLAIGLNSGSSFDGIDVALVEIELAPDGHPARPRFLDGLSYDWPTPAAEQVQRAFRNELSIFELTRLHYVAGAAYAEAALRLMAAHHLTGADLEVIGVDGQTIYQEPPQHEPFTPVTPGDGLVARWLTGELACGLQIGEPALIATYCDTPVVWGFRASDHALGGTGAPLMQYLDFVAFRDQAPALTLNIGGIANVQFVHRDRSRMLAFDTGPGNVMLDHAMRRLFGQPYDAGGAVAASGQVCAELLAELQEHPFFARRPPRCAWRLDFGAQYAESILAAWGDRLAGNDIVATLTALSAWAIGDAIARHVPLVGQVSQLVVSGGGARNPTLLARIGEYLPSHLQVVASDAFGLPAPYKEAIKFATLAYATDRELGNNIPAASGASGFAILGKRALPPRLARRTARD